MVTRRVLSARAAPTGEAAASNGVLHSATIIASSNHDPMPSSSSPPSPSPTPDFLPSPHYSSTSTTSAPSAPLLPSVAQVQAQSSSPQSSPHSSPRLRPRHVKSRSADRELLVNSPSKWRSVYTRGYTTLLMLAGFVLLIYLGHIPLMLLVFFLQLLMFRELQALSRVLSSKAVLPSFRPLHWYWFSLAVFFTYGKVYDYYFHTHTPYHTFLSFSLYCVGVLLFVWSLRRGYYKYQFEMFAWIHLTLLLIVMQSTFVVVNMFHGLIWFILPALLIVSNDCWAYVFGFFFGRTPLIRLSPKKTWEGFIGAFGMTLLTSVFLSSTLSRFSTMICPKLDMSLSTPSLCVTPPVFIPTPHHLPSLLTSLLSFLLPPGLAPHTLLISPFQLHALSLSIFASLIAPFGGFFASGFKRAFRIKDFGESIPGHGGVTDRMDCQVLMGFFVWAYYEAFVVEEGVGERMSRVMKMVERMDVDEVQRLVAQLQDMLQAQGVALSRGGQ